MMRSSGELRGVLRSRGRLVFVGIAATVLLSCGPATPPAPIPAATATASAITSSVPTAAPTAEPTASATATAQAASKPPAPEPISGTLPDKVDAKLVIHAVCNDRDCLVPGMYPSGAAAEGGAPAAIWSHDLPDKASSLTFPRHTGVDLYGVVLSGKVKLKPLEMQSQEAQIGVWKAFRAEGAGVIVAADGGPARLILAVASDGEPIAQTAALLKDKKTLKKVAWTTRPSSIEIVDFIATTDYAWGGGAMHARLGFTRGRASMGLLLASKDAPVARHLHDASWEILAPLTADGIFKRGSSPGPEITDLTEIPMTDGQIAAMPKNTLHQWIPAGTKPLFAVQIYVPPGPEQRFKKLAETTTPPGPAAK